MTRALVAASAALLLLAPRASAQQPGATPGVRALRLRADTLRVVAVPPAVTVGPRESPEAAAGRWAAAVRHRLAALRDERWRALRAGDTAALAAATPVAPAGPDLAPPPEFDPGAGGAQRGVQLLGQYADLGIQLNALIDLRFDRITNQRCTASDVTSLNVGCRGGFSPPRIDPQFNVRTGGVVGQRIHVDVDYDTQREFDASNNIRVYYQGLEDEILRRVEVGNVTFAAQRSRFITGGIPANNFGLALQAQLGALDVGAIYAQQKGNVVRARTFTVGDRTVQPVDRLAADRDFEPQRFFFVVNPRSLPGYPRLDVLNLSGASLPDSVRATQVRIYRHRSTINRPTAETNLAGLPAVARRRDSAQRAGPINWEVLIEGRDYYLDPSGLWFGLAQRLDQEDFLAVSYVTARGDTVGTFPATAAAGRTDTLELIYAPRTGPDVPTFFYEMRNAYRVGSTDDIARSSVAVSLLVGGSQRPAGGAATFLSLLGLALETDATTFDQYNRLFPRERDPNAGQPLREYYVILPSLTPFADSVRLPPGYRADSLYRTPTYLLRSQGPSPLFQLGLRYDARGGTSRGNLQLGGFQIRQGSERVVAGGRQLLRDIDYTINYDIGQLTFTSPDSLFRQPTQVTVQFEENAAFAVAPTTIVGLQARYDLGEHGSVSALALTQRQRTTFTRPPLGFEPASNLVAGVAGAFRFTPLRLTRLLDALPLVATEAPSLVTLDAEIATSRPSPNQVGVAYVETFEGENGFFIPLGENQWEYGSRPGSPRGLAAAGIDQVAGFDDADAVVLTWQNLIASATGQVLQLRAQDIDPSIRVQGTGQQGETVLWGTLAPDSIGGLPDPATFQPRWLLPHAAGPRWRSLTQPLSATGVDLSRMEYLEFWVLEDANRTARNAGTTIAFDFGTVYEDAVDFQPQRFRVSGADTTYSGRRRAGEGRLDTERDTLTGTFNAATDDRGILGDVADSILDADRNEVVRGLALCRSALADTLQVYDWGSFKQRCTRRNGALDTEDLNNDQHLDTLIAATGEAHFRFVFPLGDARYEVRSGGTVPGVGVWRLYRIPFRADTLQIGAPDIRQVRALRMTVIAPPLARPESTIFFAMARMRLVGAPWVKRASTPIAGLAGNRGEPHGEVIASVVSTENFDDLGYTPPPGVTDAGQNIGGGAQIGASQINERSLRLLAVDVRPGERAEAYYRFPEGDRNFLGYRQLRVWARGRGPGWDQEHLRFYVKVGQDENNFYLYRVPARTAVWTPEVVVDFDQWFTLRAQIEQRFLQGLPPQGAAQCGGDTLAYVACAGPYVVHVRNPSIAPPNLTRVQELAVGFVRDSGAALDSAELWVDDIRLSSVVNTPGYAGALNLAVSAGDVAELTFGVSRRDGNFRQLGDNPSYVGTDQLAFQGTIRLERFGLDRLGLVAPLTIRSDRASQDPYLVSSTDVLAAGLPNLRRPSSSGTSYSLSLRRARRGTRWWERNIIDNLGLNALWSSGSQRTELSTASSRFSDLRLDYQAAPRDLSFRYVPGFLRAALGALPGFLRGDATRGLDNGRLRLTPTSLNASAGLTRTDATRSSFRVPIATPFDTAAPVRGTTAVFRTTTGAELRPFQSMTLGVSASWDRDLKDYGDSTTIGRLAGQARGGLLGADLGFLRQRQLATRLAWSPPLASWLRPRAAWTSDFTLSRDPNSTLPERTDGDSAGAFRLPMVFAGGVSADLNTAVDLPRLLRGLFGDSSAVRRALDRVTQLDLGRRIERRSQFDRPGFDPGLGFQLGLDGMGGFRRQNGRFATAASNLVQDRMNIGMRAPFGLTVTGTYAQRSATTWFLRGRTQQEQSTVETEWPNVAARWLYSPRTGRLRSVVTSVSASLGYQERDAVSAFPSLDAAGGVGGLNLSQRSRAAPLSVTLAWAPGITTSISRNNERSVADRSGSITHGNRSNTGADASFAFRPPQEFLPLRSHVRTSVRWTSSENRSCVERAGVPGCIVIADSRRSEYNLTMDTDMPPSVTAGLSLSWVLSDDRHINRKFSQLTFTVSMRVYFAAGEVR